MPTTTLSASSQSSPTRTLTYSRPSRSFSVPTLVVENGSVKVTSPGSPLSTIVDIEATTFNSRPQPPPPTLLAKFVTAFKELETYKHGKSVVIDGHSLSIAAVTAASRHNASVALTSSSQTHENVRKSRKVIADKVQQGISVYGVSTGFGGSADTRTDQPLVLGHALLQMQHVGVLPSSTTPPPVLPLSAPISNSMPEAWVRGAILIRMNSLIRGHSGVRWELIEKMNELLTANITPMVPLRGSISASGDLSPLSYIAGTLVGNPSIRVFDGPVEFGCRNIVPSTKALAAHNIEPISLASKEHLGILNGTAFSASVAALALNDAIHLALLSQVLTAMGVEALAGTRGSFDRFIHEVARPHPGQIEAAKTIWDLLEGSTFAVTDEEEVTIAEDKGHLRQDRYPLRTAPQFIGPQLEDLLSSLTTITQECNSTTDNPLVDGATGHVHHGGNFQAMAVTNAMEKTRLSLHHFGKLLFAQCAELVDPSMNRGLPPNLAATDPSLDYHTKGVDIATAAYVAELGYLANPVSTHIQSAEMHNQAVNSMALVSGRATINSLEVLTILMSSYLYVLCQALDLRAMQRDLHHSVNQIASEELGAAFGSYITQSDLASITAKVCAVVQESLDSTTTMDATDRMQKVASSCSSTLIDFFTSQSVSISPANIGITLQSIPTFRQNLSLRAAKALDDLRRSYLSGERGKAPASKFLNKNRPVYEFVRLTLGIPMHGSENYKRFANGHGHDEQTTGQSISQIYESIRDGQLQSIVASLF